MLSRRTFLSLAAAVSARSQHSDSSALFRYRYGFWLNLHHFLYVLGRAQNGEPDRIRTAVANALSELNALETATEEQRTTWKRAVDTYAAGPSKKDLVFDSASVEETRQIAAADSEDKLPGVRRDVLIAAAPVYRSVWWPRHKTGNESRINELHPLVARYGKSISEVMTWGFAQRWPDNGFLIDVSRYANWAGAYSTTDGVVVFGSNHESMGGTQGLEILFHESAHQWDEATEQKLKTAAGRVNSRVPRALSHSLIFYTAGYATSTAVPDHKPYAEVAGLWARRALVPRRMLDQHWLPYLRRETTMEKALEGLLSALQEVK
jgi:hypothetical protein